MSPPKADHEAKRAMLRSILARIVADDRMQSASWNAVCRASNLSERLITYYYGNLQEVLWGIVAHHLKFLLARLEAAAPAEMKPRDRLAALARAYAAVIEECEPEHKTTLAHRHRLDRERVGDAREMQRWVQHAFDTALQDVLPEDQRALAKPLARSLLALLNGSVNWFHPGGALNREAYAGMAVRMVLSQVPARTPRRRRPLPSAARSAI